MAPLRYEILFPRPPLSKSRAHLISAFFASSYVLSLYLTKNGRIYFLRSDPKEKEKQRWGGRDDPDVIRARLVAVTISTLLSCVGVGVVLWTLVKAVYRNFFWTIVRSTLKRLGLTPPLSLSSVLPHFITPILFLGPLYARYLGECLPGQRLWKAENDLWPIFTTLQGIRNYVIGPITEELVFRACILSMYHLSGSSRKRMILFSPLWFGLAHLHHAWDLYNRLDRTAFARRQTIQVTLFQTLYTTLFGMHCTYLFLQTSSVFVPITSHVFCNIMGLPQYSEEIRMFPNKKRYIQLVYVAGIIGYKWTMDNWASLGAQEGIYWRGNYFR